MGQMRLAKELAKRKKISGNVCCLGRDVLHTIICKSGVEFMQYKRVEEMREEFLAGLTDAEFKIFYANSKLNSEV
jgi:hypothetical protein